MKVSKVTTARQKQAFLKLPRVLYQTGCHQDEATVRQFLDGTHPLSDDARISHYLLTQKNTVLGRMTLTVHPELDTLLLGYFECVKDQRCADALFERARQEAKHQGLSSVTGPVDVSFWVGYRLKVSLFDEVYMGEPQNKPYYQDLFERGGFASVSRYVSHYHRIIPPDHEFKKFRQRSELARARGIRLIHPDFRRFDQYLADIHGLLMELYDDFPAFHRVSLEDFKAMFKSLKRISDPDLIVLAYDGSVPVGFFIAFPDYGNELLQPNLLRQIWALARQKRRQKRIILSYSGVKRGYEGLSGALYYKVLQTVQEKGLPAVSTLMQKGKVTAGFEKDLVEKTAEYRLYRLKF